RTDTYLRLLRDEHVISPELCESALGIDLEMRRRSAESTAVRPEDRKTASTVRARLVGLLGLSDYYELDHLDLAVNATLNPSVQEAVTHELRQLRDPEKARAAGLYGFHLLDTGDPSKIVYSFSLYERHAG